MDFVFHRDKWSKLSNILLVIFLILFTQLTAHLAHSFQFGQAVKDGIENIENEIDKVLQLNSEPLKRYKRGELSPPANITNKRLKTLENEVYEIRRDISQIIESLTLNKEDQNRIATLESKMYDLSKLFDNKSQSSVQELAKNEDQLQYIIQLLIKLITEIDYTRKSALFDDVVRLIQSHELTLANEKLQQANNTTYIYTYAVEKVYNNQAGNFDLLLKFGESIPDIQHKFKVYDTLYYKIKTNHHEDIQNLIRLNQSIKKEILDRTTGAIAAQLRFDIVNDAIKDAAVKPITTAFLNNDSSSMVQNLSTDIGDMCLQCIGDIYDKVINEVWDSLSIGNLLSKVHKNLKYLQERIQIHQTIINKLERSGAVYTQAAIPLAYYMKLTMDDSNYKNMDQDRKSEYENIKSKLPQSVKNLAFSSSICIKNTAYNEYLFASCSEYARFEHDKERRNVFTWVPGNRDEPPKFKWTVSFANDHQIYLANFKVNEYLFAGTITHDSQRRNVFTWRPGGVVLNGLWNIEVDGDKVHIKNNAHGEYLFADYDRKQNSERRHVFTYIPGQKTPDSKWEIVDCSNL